MTDTKHESANGKLIVGMALASGAVGWIPVPLAGVWAASTIRKALVKQLLRRYQIEGAPGIEKVIAGTMKYSVGEATVDVVKATLMRDFSKAVRTLPMMIRFGDIYDTILLGSYLDHYAQTHYKRGKIELEEARAIVKAFEMAKDNALARTALALFSHLAKEVGRFALVTPKAVWNLLRETLANGDEAAEKIIEEDSRGIFKRSAEAVEKGISSASDAAAQGFYQAFDDAWANIAFQSDGRPK